MKLFSYVVDHDNGFAPNPYYGVCTLAHCKWKGKNNVVKLADVGDWVVGTGGKGKRSAGHGKLIYAMHVDEKLKLKEYYRDPRFRKKKPRNSSYQQRQGDNLSKTKRSVTRSVLISKRKYFYFGEKAKWIPGRFRFHPKHPLEKKGPGFRSRFKPRFVKAVTGWLQRFRPGMHGRPCGYAIDKFKISQLMSCR